MDDKTKSIVAHITIIGWIIALVMNQSDKGPNTSFYLRQVLGIFILAAVGTILLGLLGIYTLYLIWIFLMLGLVIISLLYALGGTQKPVPVLGVMFQQWFKGIS
ncbi:MAG: hypothetical protein ABIQ02_05540 [Saprospiraceae bacterium]